MASVPNYNEIIKILAMIDVCIEFHNCGAKLAKALNVFATSVLPAGQFVKNGEKLCGHLDDYQAQCRD